MMLLENFHFLRPAWLLLAPLAAWIWWLERARKDPLRGWRALIDADLLTAMTVHDRPAASGWPTGVWAALGSQAARWRGSALLVAWMTAVVAIAGPAWQLEPSPFADDPVPLMLVMYAGESMDRADLLPSRMERARLKVADVAAERQGLPLGLIAYSGSAHMVLPATRDTAIVATMAAEIDSSVMPRPGGDLPAALRLAARTLGAAGGSVVVLTDSAPTLDDADWRSLREECPWPIQFLHVGPLDSPDRDALDRASSALGASVTSLTPDSADVRSLVRRAASAPVAVAAAADGARWSEAGWWLIPLLALFSLASFRRENVESETRGADR